MLTTASATDEDVWPDAAFRPPPEVRKRIRAEALKVSTDEIARDGRGFAPWFTPYQLAAERLAAQPKQQGHQDELVELRRRVAALERFIHDRKAYLMPPKEFTEWIARGIAGTCAKLTPRIMALEKRPYLRYVGVWREATGYLEGECASYGGSMWVCKTPTTAKPGDGRDWQLAVKHGRDGRDGVTGPKGDTGAPGRPGKDFS